MIRSMKFTIIRFLLIFIYLFLLPSKKYIFSSVMLVFSLVSCFLPYSLCFDCSSLVCLQFLGFNLLFFLSFFPWFSLSFFFSLFFLRFSLVFIDFLQFVSFHFLFHFFLFSYYVFLNMFRFFLIHFVFL